MAVRVKGVLKLAVYDAADPRAGTQDPAPAAGGGEA